MPVIICLFFVHAQKNKKLRGRRGCVISHLRRSGSRAFDVAAPWLTSKRLWPIVTSSVHIRIIGRAKSNDNRIAWSWRRAHQTALIKLRGIIKWTIIKRNIINNMQAFNQLVAHIKNYKKRPVVVVFLFRGGSVSRAEKCCDNVPLHVTLFITPTPFISFLLSYANIF